MKLLFTSENLLLSVSCFGILQAIFSALLLYFYSKSDRSVNRFLALYILSLTFPIIAPLGQHLFSWKVLTLLEPSLTLLGPFLYLYVRSFKETITWKKALPHFILFFICIALALWIYFGVENKYPATETIPDAAKKNMLVMLPFSIRLVQRFIYYFLSLRALTFYQRSIQQLFSDTSKINLNWLHWLINGFLFLLFVTIADTFILLRMPEYFDLAILLSGVIVALYIFMAVFKGITQVTLWQIHPNVNKEELEKEIDYAGQTELSKPGEEQLLDQKSKTSDPKINEIATRILALMNNEKLYQEPDLTLPNLADKLQVPSYQVSQAINEGIKKSFYDLVNGYRVEEAKRLLLDAKNMNYTVLSVGFEAGFNSKTTFNTVFKKFTGMTPTEFREKEKPTLSAA